MEFWLGKGLDLSKRQKRLKKEKGIRKLEDL